MSRQWLSIPRWFCTGSLFRATQHCGQRICTRATHPPQGDLGEAHRGSQAGPHPDGTWNDLADPDGLQGLGSGATSPWPRPSSTPSTSSNRIRESSAGA